MCYQSSCSFSVIWRGDAHLSHFSLNPELSELIVLKLIWPSSGTFQHHHQLTSAAATVSIDEYIGFVFIFTAQPWYSYFGNYNNSLR